MHEWIELWKRFEIVGEMKKEKEGGGGEAGNDERNMKTTKETRTSRKENQTGAVGQRT
jgi:hypothetical protein